MDPTMTLFTFLLRTRPSVQSVQLFGSWDNFNNSYKMERDSRRDRGQWRGCHTFQDISSEGVRQKRQGGLKMGQKYYYYYEVDGLVETYDPHQPTTTVCPYLPGQTVNTLEVPIEQSPRLRSASMNSLHATDYKTMDPHDKFNTPRPAPPGPETFGSRLGTSPSIRLNHKRSAQSLSPSPSWTGLARRFLGGLRPSSRNSDRGRSLDSEDVEERPCVSYSRSEGARSTTPSGSVRSRDLSPECLRKFLSEDCPIAQPAAVSLQIPDEIVEENEDDENFATSAVSENVPFTTLSPPPFQRTLSSPAVTALRNESTTTIVPDVTRLGGETNADKPTASVRGSLLSFKLNIPGSEYSSAMSSSLTSPTSPQSAISQDPGAHTFFDDMPDDDEDDDEIENEVSSFDASSADHLPRRPRWFSPRLDLGRPFAGYQLPTAHSATTSPALPDRAPELPAGAGAGAPRGPRKNLTASPELMARTENGVVMMMPAGNKATELLTLPGIDSGLDDLASEISWIADVI